MRRKLDPIERLEADIASGRFDVLKVERSTPKPLTPEEQEIADAVLARLARHDALIERTPVEIRRELNHLRVEHDRTRRIAEKVERADEARADGGRRAFKRNVLAQSLAQENRRKVDAAQRRGLNKKQAAETLGIDIKTVRKYWRSDE
jgi:hypothetical protein